MTRSTADRLSARVGVRVAVRLALSHFRRDDRGSRRLAFGVPPNVSHSHRHFGVRP